MDGGRARFHGPNATVSGRRVIACTGCVLYVFMTFNPTWCACSLVCTHIGVYTAMIMRLRIDLLRGGSRAIPAVKKGCASRCLGLGRYTVVYVHCFGN